MSEVKKDITKRVHKTGTKDANYDLETDNDWRNVLRQRQLELCDFSITLYYIVPTARDVLPIKIFFKYCLNNLCFQLPSNER